VDEVLVDRRQLGGEHLIEQLDDVIVAPHRRDLRWGIEPVSLGEAQVATGNRRHGDVLGQQRFEGGVTAAAAGPGAAAGGELVDGGRAVLDLAVHAPLGDSVAQAGDHRRCKVALTGGVSNLYLRERARIS
jgi:hypothetical protein